MLNFNRLPLSQTAIKRIGKTSYVMEHLLQKSSMSEAVNAPTTFPIETPSKAEIMLKAQQEGLLKPRQWFAYGKLLMTFYKAGVKNAWSNNRESARIMANHYIETVDSKGNTIKSKPTGFPALSDLFAQSIFMSRLEYGAQNKLNTASVSDATLNMVKHHREGEEVAPDISSKLFRLTRSEFQLYNRSRKDTHKLGIFLLTLLVFEELTPLVCYYVPSITPTTCVLPSILPRVWKSASVQALQKYKQEQKEPVEVYATKNAYSLLEEEVRLMTRALRLAGGVVPIGWYPLTYLRRKLQNHYNYLTVDNYYLSGLNGNGNIWDLSRQELVLSCLERGLIADITQIPDTETMQWSLIRFIYEFENANIGYIGLDPQLEKVEVN